MSLVKVGYLSVLERTLNIRIMYRSLSHGILTTLSYSQQKCVDVQWTSKKTWYKCRGYV